MSSYLWALFAVASFFLLGIGNFLLKYSAAVGKIETVQGMALVWIAMGILGVVTLITLLATGRFKVAGIEPKNFLIPVAAGIILGLGIFLLKVAMVLGRAGPAAAIALSNAVLVAILARFILGEALTRSDYIAMALFLAAIVIFGLKPLG